jgi:hypothetical protein
MIVAVVAAAANPVVTSRQVIMANPRMKFFGVQFFWGPVVRAYAGRGGAEIGKL